jgi:predicted 3-demethylubiquinone-9 3-methyltransferase (glyoxalase superfamily)
MEIEYMGAHGGGAERDPLQVRREEGLMQKVTPCLWFDGRAEEAMRFYTSIFKDSKAGPVTRYGKGMPGREGSVMTASFEIEGQEFLGLNGGPDYKFNEAVSFIVRCKTQEEVDYYWDRLLEGGTPSQCGWLKDRFGVSWQVVPTVLLEMQKSGDAAQVQRVTEAMMRMVKLDIKTLTDAYGPTKAANVTP